MTDPILAEMHLIKEANGKRYPTIEALARSLAEKEQTAYAQGRRFITKTIPTTSKLNNRKRPLVAIT
jgi:hypothetical protein